MQRILFIVFTICQVAIAVPLNINLGAYSPALVVGDGEISFSGKQDVANLMNALEGAAVNAAVNNAASTAAPAVTTAPPAEGAAEGKAVVGNDPVPPANDPNTAAIAAMQSGVGLGNDLEPRADSVAPIAKRDSKRDLAGFDRALSYASGALKTSPGVELGTGEGGSGIGIKQLPGGAQFPAQAPEKRDLKNRDSSFQRRNRVTTLLVRGIDFEDTPEKSEISKLQVREIPEIAARDVALTGVAARDIDSVNLNIKEGRGLLMRFVEEDVVDELDDELETEEEEE